MSFNVCGCIAACIRVYVCVGGVCTRVGFPRILQQWLSPRRKTKDSISCSVYETGCLYCFPVYIGIPKK